MVPNRISAVRRYLKQLDLDAILITSIQNIRYLSGFTGSDGVVIVSSDSLWFLTDSRYRTQAGEEVSGFTLVEYSRKLEQCAELLQEHDFVRIGFEGSSLTVTQHALLTDILATADLVALPGDFASIRAVKDSDELIHLEEIATLASHSFLQLIPEIKPGVTERQMALRLEWLLRQAGADAASFGFIVASGARGGLPHATPTNKTICFGDLVTFDFGGIKQGYCSDETVTVAIGAIDERQREVYRIVKEAHDLALECVRPGVTCREVDAVARDYIQAQGYGDFFGHGTGHGVGLEVHEKPVVSYRSEEILQEGMVVTIEPGIYLPDWGGVRIEDTLCVTCDGFRTLTKVPKELMIL